MRDTGQALHNYQAALLDYLSGNSEAGLTRAYEIGRSSVDEGSGLLQILQLHHKAINTILESTPTGERMERLSASEDFLMEMLSTFEMASRGYFRLIAH